MNNVFFLIFAIYNCRIYPKKCMYMKRKIFQITVLFIFLYTFPVAALSEEAHAVFYVNIHSGNDLNDGLSWDCAFKNLQPAIDAALESDTIKVAAGTYLPTKKMAEAYDSKASTVMPTNDRHRSFLIKNEINLFGGFPADANNATTLSDRDWIQNKTILTGDFKGDDDDAFENRNENALHVVVLLSVTPSTQLDGFYITGGNASADSAAVYVDNVIVQRNCGGGIYAISKFNSSPTLTNLMIQDNQAEQNGGGFYNYSETNYASPKLTDVTFICNFANERGGGFFNDGMFAEPKLYNVNMTGNLASVSGGGFFCLAENTVAPLLENVLISGNKAQTGGGAFIIALTEKASPIIRNSTICGNKATNGKGGGILISAETAISDPTIQNSVIWGNKNNFISEGRNGSYPLFANNLIEGMTLSGTNLSGDTDPMFIDPIDADLAPTFSDFGDYRLLPGSPLIDQGNNSYVSLSMDLDQKTRIFGQAVDIGAFESQHVISGNETLSVARSIWSHQGNLHVIINQDDVTMHVHSINGSVVRQVNRLGEGSYSFTLPNGFYIVTLSTGETAKIIIK